MTRERLLDAVWGWEYPARHAHGGRAWPSCAGRWTMTRPSRYIETIPGERLSLCGTSERGEAAMALKTMC